MIKVGLIGCGFMGAMHANCYRAIEGVELVAVADIRREKAEAIAASSDVKIYSDGMELIAAGGLDIIDVCLPTFLHAKYAMAAMEAAKYVFVEKPVALTNDEAAAMIEKAKATGAQVQVGQVIRFWDEYVELKKIYESGKYGRIVNANFRRISPRPDWGWNDWLLDISLSGGAAQDLHVHDIDYVLSLLGKPKSFYTAKNNIGEGNSYVNTLMTYDDAVVGVEGTWDLPGAYPFTASFRVVFEKAVVENVGGKFMLYADGTASEIKIEKVELQTSNVGGNISDLGGYYNELLYFTDRAKSGEPVERATLTDAAESLSFVLSEINFKG